MRSNEPFSNLAYSVPAPERTCERALPFFENTPGTLCMLEGECICVMIGLFISMVHVGIVNTCRFWSSKPGEEPSERCNDLFRHVNTQHPPRRGHINALLPLSENTTWIRWMLEIGGGSTRKDLSRRCFMTATYFVSSTTINFAVQSREQSHGKLKQCFGDDDTHRERHRRHALVPRHLFENAQCIACGCKGRKRMKTHRFIYSSSYARLTFIRIKTAKILRVRGQKETHQNPITDLWNADTQRERQRNIHSLSTDFFEITYRMTFVSWCRKRNLGM
jgi:hypothetical protein